MTEDLLEALLRTALAEQTTLDARTLPRFAEALRARAAQILAERVRPIEERAAAFEKEKEYWSSASRAASEAHDRLLAHHRATLLRLAQTLEAMPACLPWGYRRVRAQILELLEILRKEAR